MPHTQGWFPTQKRLWGNSSGRFSYSENPVKTASLHIAYQKSRQHKNKGVFDLNLSRNFAEEKKNNGHPRLEVIGSHFAEDFLTSRKREIGKSCPLKRKKGTSRTSPGGRLFSLMKVRNCAKTRCLVQMKNASQALWTLAGVCEIWWWNSPPENNRRTLHDRV